MAVRNTGFGLIFKEAPDYDAPNSAEFRIKMYDPVYISSAV